MNTQHAITAFLTMICTFLLFGCAALPFIITGVPAGLALLPGAVFAGFMGAYVYAGI